MRYRVKGTEITVLSDETLVAGSVERHFVTFEFDESWDGYVVKIATFKRGAVSFERILDDGTCEIPWEILAGSGILQISVRGEAEGGTHATAYAPFKHIYGSGAKGKTAADVPTPDVWQQLLAAIGDITPYVGENGHWYVGDVDTGVAAQGEKGKDGDDYVLTDADKEGIAVTAAKYTVGKQLVLNAAEWVDDSDIKLYMNGAPYKYVRVGYHATADDKGGAMLTVGAGITALNEWQTVNIEFTLASDVEAFGLYFTGGADTKYIQPYDIMDVKVYAASDAKKSNLFSDDIEEQHWVTNNKGTKRAIAMSDGVKFVHVFRQAYNYVQLRSTQKIPLAAGTYVFECKIRLSPWLYHYVAPFYDAHSEYSLTVAPTCECASAYKNRGIYCAAFGNYSVTFACTTIPTSEIVVNAMVHKASGDAGMIFQ